MSTRQASRGRTVAVWALIVAASLLAIASATTTWAKRQALDTDTWVKATDEVLATPAVQQALAAYVVNQLYQNVDVGATLQERLPTDLKGLAGPLAAALRTPAEQAVERLLATPQAQQLFSQVNRQAHTTLVNILEDKTRVGSTAGGVVSLDLGALVRQIGQELGIPAAALDKLPADAGNIVLVKSDQLEAAQQLTKAIKVLSAVLFLAVLAFYVWAVYLAIDRRKAIRNIGWSLTLSAFVLLAIRRGVLGYVENLVTQAQYKGTAHATLLIWTSLLRELALAGVAYGLVTVGWAVVAGPTHAGTAVRRTLAPALNLSAGLVWCWAGGLFLLLTLWGPTPAFDFGSRLAVLAGLYGLGIWALRRRTLAEFADVHMSDIAEGPVRVYRRITHRAA
jgi:hypothetical protein